MLTMVIVAKVHIHYFGNHLIVMDFHCFPCFRVHVLCSLFCCNVTIALEVLSGTLREYVTMRLKTESSMTEMISLR
jgi:hypothetical protein